ncbi:hypothetical protein Nepgr_002277 [Nepenthes gracilis]|uniref:Uncharacterized protein n=1 Tax=Nepenthes gracilis TaxID=150966 RepID=A0AAD3RY65_NEPGR|nr:hypothetical protein Nepgr_002277 [Nepenthes gracilis]
MDGNSLLLGAAPLQQTSTTQIIGNGSDGGSSEAKGDETMRIWDCGSPLYDLHELVSVSFLVERHLMAVPSLGGSRRFKSHHNHDRHHAAVVAGLKKKMGYGCLLWRGWKKKRKAEKITKKSNELFSTGSFKWFP